MKIQDNKLSSVAAYFHLQLDQLYDPNEVQQFFEIATEHLLHLSRIQALLEKDKLLSESDLLRFIRFVKRLKKEEPIQYITGSTEFMGMVVLTTPAALIPRPETEELIVWIGDQYNADNKSPSKVLDIGSGTGCIALALKKVFPGAEVKGVDISDEAILLAEQNAKKNNLKVKFMKADALKLGESDDAGFDLIVSNPPYVRKKESELMANNVLDYEPHIALFVEDSDPLIFYKAIAQWAIQTLNIEGWLYFETNEQLANEVASILVKLEFGLVEIRNDIRDKPRMVRGKRKK